MARSKRKREPAPAAGMLGIMASDTRAKATPVVWPVKGPGRKRIVQPGSIDELSARIANEIAAECVEKIRAAVEIMARDALARLLGKR